MGILLENITQAFKSANLSLYEVGGCVRDSIIGREYHDIDMATNATPEQIKKLLEGMGTIYTVGEKFGTIGLKTNDQTIEITTFRKEVYLKNSRKPKVTFGNSLYEDLKRRDFSINAIAREPITGTIIDPFGGQADIKKKIIRVVGNNSFEDDPLRMLRAIRFACQLGFSLRITINHPEMLNTISKERVRDEVNKILLSPRAAYGWRKLCQCGLMSYIAPEFMRLKDIPQGKNHVKDAFEHSLQVLFKGARLDEKEKNLIFRLACILHDIGKADTRTEDDNGVHFYFHHNVGARKARKLLRRLRYDNDTVESVCHLIEYHMTPVMLQKEIVNHKVRKKIILRLVHRVGRDNIQLLMDLVRCDIRSSKNPRYKFMNVLARLVDEALTEQPEQPDSPINGNEIMAEFGLKPGKRVGRIKNYLTSLVIDGVLKNDDREGAFTKAREFMKNE